MAAPLGTQQPQERASCVVERATLPDPLVALCEQGYTVVGPTVRDGGIVYDEIGTMADLPCGWTAKQEAGTYRLERREDDAVFGYAVGSHSGSVFSSRPFSALHASATSDFTVDADQGAGAQVGPPRGPLM